MLKVNSRLAFFLAWMELLVMKTVDAVTPEEIRRIAQKYLWGKDVHIYYPAHFCAVWILMGFTY
jgi:predicted Zn-dependent peptidase